MKTSLYNKLPKKELRFLLFFFPPFLFLARQTVDQRICIAKQGPPLFALPPAVKFSWSRSHFIKHSNNKKKKKKRISRKKEKKNCAESHFCIEEEENRNEDAPKNVTPSLSKIIIKELFSPPLSPSQFFLATLLGFILLNGVKRSGHSVCVWSDFMALYNSIKREKDKKKKKKDKLLSNRLSKIN
jgi:hypothetical protein